MIRMLLNTMSVRAEPLKMKEQFTPSSETPQERTGLLLHMLDQQGYRQANYRDWGVEVVRALHRCDVYFRPDSKVSLIKPVLYQEMGSVAYLGVTTYHNPDSEHMLAAAYAVDNNKLFIRDCLASELEWTSFILYKLERFAIDFPFNII